MKTIILPLFLQFFLYFGSMKWPNQEDIPKSILKGNKSIYADLSGLNGKGRILFIDPKCAVIGIESVPYMLFLTPDFKEENLPVNVRKHIFEVQRIVLQPSFLVNSSKTLNTCHIPLWLTNYKKVEYLRLDHVQLDDLIILKSLTIQYLVIENVKCTNDNNIVAAIQQFRYLKKICYDKSLPSNIRQTIEKINPNLKFELVSD